MHKMCATKVPYDSGSGGPNRILLTEQDRYLKEVLLENLDLVKMRREKSSLNEATKITEKRKVEVSKEKDQTVDRQGNFVKNLYFIYYYTDNSENLSKPNPDKSKNLSKLNPNKSENLSNSDTFEVYMYFEP